jgi:hypothetical protein
MTKANMTLYENAAKLRTYYTVKKVIDFPVPSRDDTNQTLCGLE